MNLEILERPYEIIFPERSFIKPRIVVSSKKIYVFKGLERISVRGFLKDWLKDYAKSVITRRVSYYSDKFELTINRITIKDQKSLWGSCSNRKNLNFSWRLILAPKRVMNYVIIHELSHITEMNHSRRFWRLLESRMPDYETQQDWLDKHGYKLKETLK